jgi:hypothetical protein
MKFLREIVVVGALLAGASAQAAPKNIDDCEKIKEPMAYNECLASFGPAVGHVGSGQSYAPASEGEPRAAVGKGRRASAYHATARRGAGGWRCMGPMGGCGWSSRRGRGEDMPQNAPRAGNWRPYALFY